jgi:hypothetical protein
MTCPAGDTPISHPKKTTCWIHVGMHKTGSTAIQQNLSKANLHQTWQLMKTGGRPNMGAALTAMFDDEPEKLFWFKQRGESREAVIQQGRAWQTELVSDIHKLNGATCIISSEFISGFAWDTARRFHDFIRPLFDEIRVIGYIRPPISYCVSQYQEMLKYGHSRFNIDEVHLNYRERFEKFDAIFGRDSVVLRKFDPGSFPDRCIIRDFCQQIGIGFPEDLQVKRRNESLCREACGLLYAYRKYGPVYGKGGAAFEENSQLVKGLAAIRGGSLKVHESLMTRMLESKAEDIMWMEQRLGVSLHELTGKDDGCVSSEQDLLTISRSSCRKFASRFGKQTNSKIPGRWIPIGDPVDPVKAAEFIERCRKRATRCSDSSDPAIARAENSGEKPAKRIASFRYLRKIVKRGKEWIRKASGSES